MTVISSALGVLVMLVVFALALAVINLCLLDIWTMELKEEITAHEGTD